MARVTSSSGRRPQAVINDAAMPSNGITSMKGDRVRNARLVARRERTFSGCDTWITWPRICTVKVRQLPSGVGVLE